MTDEERARRIAGFEVGTVQRYGENLDEAAAAILLALEEKQPEVLR